MEIEQLAGERPEALARIAVDPNTGIDDAKAKEIVETAGFDAETGAKIVPVLKSLWEVYRDEDATLVEVNPLVKTEDGEIIALDGGHRQVGALGAVEEQREVVLLGDPGPRGDHDGADGEALDVHAEDGLRVLLGLLRRLGDLDAAGLAAATGLDLRLDHGDTAALGPDGLGGRAGLLWCGGGGAGQNRHSVRLEHVARLVLEEIHGSNPSSSAKGVVRP
jgi:hypothetical protein